MEREQVLKKANEVLDGNEEVERVTLTVKNDDGTQVKAVVKAEQEE